MTNSTGPIPEPCTMLALMLWLEDVIPLKRVQLKGEALKNTSKLETSTRISGYQRVESKKLAKYMTKCLFSLSFPCLA
jgi:hypothetical protein